MEPVSFFVAALAAWRAAHFLYAEDGPWQSVARLRAALVGRQVRTLDCFLCVSVLPALPAAMWMGSEWRQWLLLWPALSAAVILIERAAFPGTFADAPVFSEDEESSNVLRQD
jgi:hypothetical protein